MSSTFRHLGRYSDLVDAARARAHPWPAPRGRASTPEALLDALGFFSPPEVPHATVGRRWEADGVAGEELFWSVGYGPPTRAFLLQSADAKGSMPGVVALHGHDGFKFHGVEKIADGPDGPDPSIVALRRDLYGGRALANELARDGFVVLAHDTFGWGSRRFRREDMPEQTALVTDAMWQGREPDEVTWYNTAAWHHEHVVEKYCRLLGTTIAGIVTSEDRIAVAYLAGRPEVRPDGIGVIGLSGGGCRAALLHATDDRVRAAVVVAMMSTYAELLDHNVVDHTWMFFPDGWTRHGDWPDVAASAGPSPLLVQYDSDDELFTMDGMRAAHRLLEARYAATGRSDNYTGEFYDGPHKFDEAMQRAAFMWLHRFMDVAR